jgi:hypothetical protein
MLAAGVLAGTAWAGWQLWPSGPGSAEPLLTSYEDLLGCLYTPAESAPLESVKLRSIALPDFPGSTAIWGATGRDHRGHIWVGVSAHANTNFPSARLMEYDPERDQLHVRGDVLNELRRDGRARVGEGQMKIHSRIVQGEDGHLYFASMDEQGEQTDGGRLPTWGSHLWRLRLPSYRWEHLLRVREALIAVAGAGRWIYALGYFNHVVYQYDCRTGQSRSLAVGAAGGHISRNFICSVGGHAYVPRLQPAAEGGPLTTTLVELSSELREVQAVPLVHYTQTRDDDSHGIVSFQPLQGGSFVFATDQGYLYRVIPQAGRAALVIELGWFHARGRCYTASMFTSDGDQHLMGFARRDTPSGLRNEWLVYDLTTGICRAYPVTLPELEGQPLGNPVLYGSVTRDNAGRCYLAGTCTVSDRQRPVLLQVAPA